VWEALAARTRSVASVAEALWGLGST
jgi:hypothetical protein